MTDQTTTEAPKKKTAEVTTVKMADGRAVDFAGKRKLNKTSMVDDSNMRSITLPTAAVQLDFRSGETRTFVLPDALLIKFALHGAEQKLGDEIAGLDDIDDAVIAVDELIDRLSKGEWNVAREGNGLAGTSVLARALVEHTGKTMEQIKLFLKDKTQAQKIALRNNPKIKPIIDKIEAEKAAKTGGVDTEALLGELG
jgi:hypothetical protein